MKIYTEIEIQASDEQVWNLLTDFASFPHWNLFIRQISGLLSEGAQLTVHFQPPGRDIVTFRPTVITVEPNRKLRWLWHFLIPGLFDVEHSFIIEPLASDVYDGLRLRVCFIQQESFQGLLVPLLARRLNIDVRQGFEAMNQTLKTKAERINQTTTTSLDTQV
ncbi:SRPBCC domain-containing protein [Nostoc sp. DedSLP04]|uniref:SRPBCC domain-containing protein n=1 Tax=Nostoc sp. DedSLP04 TaxID=3075401 RepID=UPI002AD37818|nr:SRPBCC domain-containing protein [Nostoc sp. DedSLP04]MDZ8032331.1 SRPBCC domain-containing protein [Nostoc sp. DedSLP04]